MIYTAYYWLENTHGLEPRIEYYEFKNGGTMRQMSDFHVKFWKKIVKKLNKTIWNNNLLVGRFPVEDVFKEMIQSKPYETQMVR